MFRSHKRKPLDWILACRWIAALLVTAFCAWTEGGAAEGRTFVVAQHHPAAADNNPGSVDKPFQSISCASMEAQPGDTVRIEDGVYRETVIVEQSGAEKRPIVFEAEPGAHVVVTGADVVGSTSRNNPVGGWPTLLRRNLRRPPNRTN